MPTLTQRTARRRASAKTSRRPTQSFTLILDGDLDDGQTERLYERCPDATAGTRSGIPFVAFDRKAATLPEAVDGAIRDVEDVTKQQVVRVEPEELVNASDIARRTGRTRESVRLLIEGARGPGNFPRPVAWVGNRPLWGWADVAAWLVEYGLDHSPTAHSAAFVSALNGALNVRRLAPHLSDRAARDALTRVLEMKAPYLAGRALISRRTPKRVSSQ